jgi:MGS-like domain-containing protein
MRNTTLAMGGQKTIAIVAHDNKKQDLLAWAKFNRDALSSHSLIATGTTGLLLQAELDLPVTRVQSGPLGGNQQIGAKISEGEIDVLISFGIHWSLTPRSRRQGTASHRRGLEYSDRVQPRFSRFFDFFVVDAGTI